MYLHFLFRRLVGLSPQAKFLLLRSLKYYGTVILPLKRATVLAQDLGLGVKTVSTVLEHMVEEGHLEKIKTRVQGRKGRSSIIGFLSLKPLIELQEDWVANSRNVPHALIISELIESDLAEYSLSLTNKLFLAVLLAHADDSGVIRDMGVADLMELTGMSRDRIGYQMDSLKQHGYIRSSVSGVTMPGIFGASPGFIFLNLKHFKYREHSYGGVSILLLAEYEYEFNFFREAGWICSEVKLLSEDTDRDSSNRRLEMLAADFNFEGEIKDIPRFFNSIKFKPEVIYLQVKLNDYASYLLSNFWEDLKDLRWDSDVIIGRVYKDVSRMSVGIQKSPDFSPEKLDLLARFLFSVALKIAKQVQILLLSAGNYPYAKMTCAILPYSIGRSQRSAKYTVDLCVEVYSQAIDTNLGYIKLGGKQFDKLSPIEQGVEEDLGFGTRCSAGLISRNYSQ